MWCICVMEFYLAVKKNDIMSSVDKWIELENIILSVLTQIQKDRRACLIYESHSSIARCKHIMWSCHKSQECRKGSWEKSPRDGDSRT